MNSQPNQVSYKIRILIIKKWDPEHYNKFIWESLNPHFSEYPWRAKIAHSSLLNTTLIPRPCCNMMQSHLLWKQTWTYLKFIPISPTGHKKITISDRTKKCWFCWGSKKSNAKKSYLTSQHISVGARKVCTEMKFQDDDQGD